MALIEFSKPLNRARKLETKEAVFRARRLILRQLVLAYLSREGYAQSAAAFTSEAGLTDDYTLCDNIDLEIILQEYTSYYMMKYNKQPVFCKKVEPQKPAKSATTRKPSPRKPPQDDQPSQIKEHLPFGLSITALSKEIITEPSQLKPLTPFLLNATKEKIEITQLLYQGIIRNSKVKLSDVKGLDVAKNLLLEAVVYPLKFPEVFTGILEPWKGILLHGPPGTGKTMLARAVANEGCCTFFNVTSSTIVNKWRGESEKILKILFELAEYYAPSIIFVDELESVASERDGAGEHEASRRLKAQLLTELDGVQPTGGRVFLLACTNLPWDVDSAMLRRLEKRIYTPLPDLATRVAMFQEFLASGNVAVERGVSVEEFAKSSEGYSGSDIRMVCKEAVMSSVRKLLPELRHRGEQVRKHLVKACDVKAAILKTKPISKHLTEKHLRWQESLGSC